MQRPDPKTVRWGILVVLLILWEVVPLTGLLNVIIEVPAPSQYTALATGSIEVEGLTVIVKV
jgi:hypothetical protein